MWRVFFYDEQSFITTLIAGSEGCVLLNFNQLNYTISVEGTAEIFDHSCFIVEWQAEELIIETNYIEIVNDTVFQVAYQEPNYTPVETNTILTPIFPSVDSEWQGMFGGPANFKVQKLANILVPVDTVLAFIYQINDEDSGEYLGSMTYSEDIGLLSLKQISEQGTFSIALASYTIEGGNGVFPLAIGNQWIYVDDNYDEMQILAYNRLVKDMNGLMDNQFINLIQTNFNLKPLSNSVKPKTRNFFSMFLNGHWYELKAKDQILSNDPVEGLDAAILQNYLLKPVLGIDDPRTNKKIDFVGGIRGLEELELRCNLDAAIAFALYPISIEDLLIVADAGKVMPPKSTWFEPKLADGLVSLVLD